MGGNSSRKKPIRRANKGRKGNFKTRLKQKSGDQKYVTGELLPGKTKGGGTRTPST